MGVVCLAMLTAARAEEAPLEANAEVAVLSSYTSRGQVNNDRPVMQPEITVGKGGFSFNAWGNFNLTDRITDKEDFSEIDFVLGYALPFETVEVEAGFIEYVFPHCVTEEDQELNGEIVSERKAAPGTREFYVNSSYPNPYLTPILEIYYDCDEADGFYFYGALEKEIQLFETLAVTPGFSTGFGTRKYNDFFFGVSKNGWNDGNVYINTEVALTDDIVLAGQLAYMWLWDSEIEEGAEITYLDTKQLYGGLALACEF